MPKPVSDTIPVCTDAWLGVPLMELWRLPLPHQHNSRVNRMLGRLVAAVVRPRIESVTGLEHIMPQRGAFLVAANHVCRRDAFYLPAVLLIARGGLPVHFLADWNFKLIPGISTIYRRSGAITVSRKSARPRILNLLKPALTGDAPPAVVARDILASGRPIGLFPEGTTNRDPARLLRGRFGCARLSLESGAPVVPVGICYPGYDESSSKPLTAAVRITIGAPLSPPTMARSGRAPRDLVHKWHARVMTEVSALCGKPWVDINAFPATLRGDD